MRRAPILYGYIQTCCTTVFALVLLCIGTISLHADVYLLGTGDRLAVTLLENEKISGSYLIGTDGTVSIPGIGIVDAAGVDLRTFEARLLEAAADKIVDPSISVQIDNYRPFYVLGDVEKSGQYEFAPGLNVMKAVAIAGGFDDVGNVDVFNRAIAGAPARKSLVEGRIEMFGTQVHLARLHAETEMAESFSYLPPDGETPNDEQIKLIDNAVALFETRQTAFLTQREKLKNTLDARKLEVESYDDQIAVQNEVVASIQQDRQRLEEANERGIVSETRLSQGIREEQSVRSQLMQIITLKRQAETNLISIERDLAQLIVIRDVEINQNIQFYEETRQKLTVRLREDRKTLRQVGDKVANNGKENTYQLELYRKGARLDQNVTPATPLEPGDTLMVIYEDDDAVAN